MKHYLSFLLIAFFLGAITGLNAQITLYPIKNDTAYFKYTFTGKLKPVSALKAEIRIVESYKNNELVERTRFSMPGSQLLQREFYNGGRPYGKWRYYNEAGELIHERDFAKLKYGDCIIKPFVEDGVFLPKFGSNENDLMQYLRANMKYPAISRSLGTSGTVIINFVVDEIGKANVSHICGDGLDGYCDLVVWEIIEQMPRWKPGSKDGEPVKVKYYLPFEFKL